MPHAMYTPFSAILRVGKGGGSLGMIQDCQISRIVNQLHRDANDMICPVSDDCSQMHQHTVDI